ncbi:MAG: ATP-dependent helicase HrpB [Leptospirales bacterium]|nr:ATP-dependent helicase HrpB [Leptospirales bacterium]
MKLPALSVEQFPAVQCAAELRHALGRSGVATLSAPPGAGKSTALPLALLELLGEGQRMILLSPRRIAARLTAARLAELLGCRLGDTVGYSVRLESRTSAATRIEVATEGVLTRRLQRDPELPGVGLLIFDEFHERSIHADLALALALEAREALRPDLRILVMSATLDMAATARYLGDAPQIQASGKQFDVKLNYEEEAPSLQSAARQCAQQPAVFADRFARFTLRALRQSAGDALVFLPGQGEIRRVRARLETMLSGEATLAALYGDLTLSDQQRALQPDAQGRRKVTLSTNIAETSLTIAGIRVVIDSGLARVSRLAPARGLAALHTEAISQASATQRAGRAGRLTAGVAFRHWSRRDDALLVAHNEAEILHSDLCPLALELALWGAQAPRWLDAPPPAALAEARSLLTKLGAIDGQGAIQSLGRAMASLSVHPRLARMILCAPNASMQDEACRIAVLLSERDIMINDSTEGRTSIDLTRRLGLLAERHSSARGQGAFAHLLRTAAALQRQARRALSTTQSAAFQAPASSAGGLVALAYPDRVAKRRAGGGYLLANGGGASAPESDPLAASPFLAIADLEANEAGARVRIAAALPENELRSIFKNDLATTIAARLTGEGARGEEIHELRLGALALESRSAPLSAERAHELIWSQLRLRGLAALKMPEEAELLRRRIEFLRSHGEDLPPCDENSLLAELEIWLAPFALDAASLRELQRVDLTGALRARLNRQQLQRLEAGAPERLAVPSGSQIAVEYVGGEARLAVRLQEVFGLAESPRIAFGRVALTLELLSPAMRPIQITRDLRNFWNQTYAEVRKELRGRYPKHHWPEDPWTASAVRGAKRKR